MQLMRVSQFVFHSQAPKDAEVPLQDLVLWRNVNTAIDKLQQLGLSVTKKRWKKGGAEFTQFRVSKNGLTLKITHKIAHDDLMTFVSIQ
jgi:hypothetical protein